MLELCRCASDLLVIVVCGGDVLGHQSCAKECLNLSVCRPADDDRFVELFECFCKRLCDEIMWHLQQCRDLLSVIFLNRCSPS